MWIRAAGLVLLALLAGCGGNGTAEAAGDRAPGRDAAVYAAVLRHYLTSEDGGMGKDHKWSVVYVLDTAVEDAGDATRNADGSDGAKIPTGTRADVTRALADVAPVRFVADRGSVVTGKDGCQLATKDAILVTLAPVPESGDRLKIGINGWQSCMAGTWFTYVVARDGDGWRVSGTTGPVSIS